MYPNLYSRNLELCSKHQSPAKLFAGLIQFTKMCATVSSNNDLIVEGPDVVSNNPGYHKKSVT